MTETMRTWAVAIYEETSVYMSVWKPYKYPSPWRLIVPIVAEDLWRRRKQPLSPEEVATALTKVRL